MKISQIVDESLHGWGDFPAIIEFNPGYSPKSLSPDELLAAIDERARFFMDQGLGKDILVPIFLENGIEFTVALLALLKIEAVPIMIKMEFRRLELEEIFRNADPQFIITEEKHSPYIQPFTKLRRVLIWDGREYSVLGEQKNLVARADLPNDIATINYTYRGYGYPLGALTTHRQYLSSVYQLQGMIHFQNGESLLVILPMSHIFPLVGCVFLPLIFRNTALIAKTLNPRQLIQAIEEYSIVNIIAVPEIYELLFRTIGENGLPSTLKRLVSGGSTLTAEKHRIYEKTFGVQVIHGYGLTEFAPVSGNIFGNTRGTMGPVGPLIKYRIVDKELQIMGSAITAGYYRREKETREAFDDSWFLTGDYCRMDNGHLVFTGEKKSTCKVNGNLVDLVEVSNAVRSYPGIEKAEIKFKDSQLIAEIAFSKDADNDPKSLRRYLGGLIAGYKIPRFVVQDVMK